MTRRIITHRGTLPPVLKRSDVRSSSSTRGGDEVGVAGGESKKVLNGGDQLAGGRVEVGVSWVGAGDGSGAVFVIELVGGVSGSCSIRGDGGFCGTL